MTSWISRLFATQSKPRAERRSYKPSLEALEERAVPANFTVLNTADFGAGSLRAAITSANANPGLDNIVFATTGQNVVRTLHLSAELPAIVDPVNILGPVFTTTNSRGAVLSAKPLFEIDGLGIEGADLCGLRLLSTAGGSTIKGLTINGFNSIGSTAILMNSSRGNIIQGCWIGTTNDGNGDAGNITGIAIRNGSSNTIVGGSGVLQRNVISGNQFGIVMGDGGAVSNGNTIQGNFIGSNATGAARLGNFIGMSIGAASVFNTIAANVISANTEAGVFINDSNLNVIKSNKIGAAFNGVSALGNGRFGIVLVNGAERNTIGGLGSGDGNTIAFNGERGVLIGSVPSSGLFGIPAGTGNSVLSNRIFSSPNSLIDLGPNDNPTANDLGDTDTGPNNLQNKPILTSALPFNGQTLVSGSINTTANAPLLIQYFLCNVFDANGVPLDMSLLPASSSLTSDAAGNANFDVLVASPANGAAILATATNTFTGDTSEMNIVFVSNNPPMIRDDVLTPDINEGQKATLSGRLVDPNPGDKLRLVVNWGDGSPVQTYRPGLDPFAFKHRYDDDGVYNVNFTWLDNHGGSNTRTRQVVVHNVEPELRGLDLSREHPRVHQLIVLSGRIVDPGDDTFTLTVNWGDGTTETIERERDGKFHLKHRFQHAGQFTIQLTVSDDDGGVNTISHPIAVL